MSYDHVETVGGKMQWTQAAVRRRSPTNSRAWHQTVGKRKNEMFLLLQLLLLQPNATQ